MLKIKAKGQTESEIFFLSKVRDGTLEISKSGKVYNNKTKRYIGTTGSGKYPKISMARNGRKDICHIQIHRLNWLVHKGDIDKSKVLNHKDLNKQNPDLDNLEEITQLNNIKHAVKNGAFKDQKGAENNNASFTEIDVVISRKLYNLGLVNIHDITKIYKVHVVTVRAMLLGKTYPNYDFKVNKIYTEKEFKEVRGKTINLVKLHKNKDLKDILGLPENIINKIKEKFS